MLGGSSTCDVIIDGRSVAVRIEILAGHALGESIQSYHLCLDLKLNDFDFAIHSFLLS